MSRVNILENEYTSVWYDVQRKIVCQKFHKVIYGRQFRESLDAVIEAMQKYGAEKRLSDYTAGSSLSASDSEWLLNDWYPRAVKAGYKYVAMVQPVKVIGQMDMRQNVRSLQEMGCLIRIFGKVDEAIAWLEAQGPETAGESG